ncbi:hypothetical protein [Kaistella sp.]|uniref:hypothetical protein n=1 Tax=Kaistella sp. TaxID=2782235 RepID=UPI003C4416C7
MNWIYTIYFFLPNFKRFGFPGKVVNKALEMITKRILDLVVPSSLKRTQKEQLSGINTEEREIEYIVSLTSFPGRINEVWTTVETLLRQSFKPDQIILWLSEVQFPDKSIPNSLLDLKKRGLQIEFVKDDIRSHKKYFYAFERFPNSAVITVDDDVYYPADTLKYLIEANNRNKESVVANRAHQITFEGEKMQTYRQWRHNVKSKRKSSHLYVPTGVGGVLYPPYSYHDDIFDDEVFKRICFMADDLWLKVATLRNNTTVTITPYFNKDLLTVGRSQNIKLVSSNSMGGGNDIQFRDVLEHFKIDIYSYKDK